MTGTLRTAGGYGLVVERPSMLTARLTVTELLALACLVEQQSAQAEIARDVERADRLAGRAADLRQQSRRPMPVGRPPRPQTAHQRLIIATWAGAAA